MAKDIEMQPGQFDANEVTEQINENVSEEQKQVDAEKARKIEAQKQAEANRKDSFNNKYEPIDHPDEDKDDRWYNKAWKWIKGGVGKAADTLSKPMADAARFVMDLTSIFITGVAWLGRTLFRSGHSKPNYKNSMPVDKSVGSDEVVNSGKANMGIKDMLQQYAKNNQDEIKQNVNDIKQGIGNKKIEQNSVNNKQKNNKVERQDVVL